MNKYIPFTSRDERLDDTFYIVSDGDIIVSKKTFLATNWAEPWKSFLHVHHVIVLMRQNYSYKYTWIHSQINRNRYSKTRFYSRKYKVYKTVIF